MRRLILLLGTLCLSACLGSTDASSGPPSDPATETFASSLGVNIAQMQKTAAGTYYKDVQVGTGATLTSPVTAVVTYAGYFKNGVRFDSGQSVAIPLSGAVYGFQDGMLGMRVGGERLIVIPSALGYGDRDYGTIPANSTLIFDVRLEQIP